MRRGSIGNKSVYSAESMIPDDRLLPSGLSVRKTLLRRVAALLLAASMLAGFPASMPAHAATQEEIDELRNQKEALAELREARQITIDSLISEQADVFETKIAMDLRNEATLEQMRLNDEEIAMYDEMIAEKAEEVAQALQLEEEQLKRYRIRVRAMEEGGTSTYLAMLLQVTTVEEFLAAMDDIGEIMESDRKLADDYTRAREQTEAVQREFEEYRAGVQAQQDILREEQEELQKDIDEAGALIQSLSDEIRDNRAVYDEILAMEEETDRELRSKIAEMERERQSYAITAVSSTGVLAWPCPSCTYLTSRFGMRVHPILGTVRTHSGIDIGAAAGAAVTAADGGTVTQAGNAGDGYGNCVIINHGNGIVTLYGHLSSISVSYGDTVGQGQLIGAVGSSGLATGPHLHFEVWLNGSRVDPEQFFSGLTYSPDACV